MKNQKMENNCNCGYCSSMEGKQSRSARLSGFAGFLLLVFFLSFAVSFKLAFEKSYSTFFSSSRSNELLASGSPASGVSSSRPSLSERLQFLLNSPAKKGFATPQEKLDNVIKLIQNFYVNKKSEQELYDAAIAGMISSLDPHSVYLTKSELSDLQADMSGEFGGLGITINKGANGIEIISPIDDTPAYRAGIKAGDIIVAIGDKTTRGMEVMDAVRLMRGEPGTKIKITVYRPSTQKLKTYSLERAIIDAPAVKVFYAGDGLYYVRVSQFQKGVAADILANIKELAESSPISGIVLDLRNDPGGLLEEAINVSDLFLPEGAIVSVKNPLSKDESNIYKSKTGDAFESVPLVVIINSGSASASEIVASAIKDRHRGLIVGEQSFGKGSVQSVFKLADGSAIKMTISLYYSPSGNSLQNVGVSPDIRFHDNVKLVEHTEDQEAANIEKLLHESSLANHLAGESSGLASASAKKDKEIAKEFEEMLNKDPQLLQALDVLNALRFGNLLKG